MLNSIKIIHKPTQYSVLCLVHIFFVFTLALSVNIKEIGHAGLYIGY